MFGLDLFTNPLQGRAKLRARSDPGSSILGLDLLVDNDDFNYLSFFTGAERETCESHRVDQI